MGNSVYKRRCLRFKYREIIGVEKGKTEGEFRMVSCSITKNVLRRPLNQQYFGRVTPLQHIGKNSQKPPTNWYHGVI